MFSVKGTEISKTQFTPVKMKSYGHVTFMVKKIGLNTKMCPDTQDL